MPNKLFPMLTAVVLFVSLISAADAQDDLSVTLPLPRGDKPLITAHLTQASLNVVAADVTEVIVEATFNADEKVDPEAQSEDGFTIINSSGLAFDARTDGDTIVIDAGSWETETYVTIQIPADVGVKAWSNQGDYIRVSGISGDLELSSNGGDIVLEDVSGHIVADASNGDLIVDWVGSNPTQPMAFTSRNGDVDVAFPDDLRATLKLQTRYGSVKTAFEVSNQRTVVDQSGEPNRIRVESWTQADINGGGPELTMRTFHGDLIIRNSRTVRPAAGSGE